MDDFIQGVGVQLLKYQNKRIKVTFYIKIVLYFKSENYLIPECQICYIKLGNVSNSEDCECRGGGHRSCKVTFYLDKRGKWQHHLVNFTLLLCNDNCILVGKVFYVVTIITAVYNNE